MKKSAKYFWTSFVVTAVSMLAVNNGMEADHPLLPIMSIALMVAWFVLIPIGFYHRSKEKKAAYNALPPEEKARVDVANEQKVAAAQAHWEEVRAANTIVSTAIVDTTMKSKTKASAGSSVVRGAVGGALFGPVGMVAGAVTPKKTTITKAKTVTFSVRYANGDCRLETVKNGSARFKELAKYIA